jgi:HEAT repeats
MSVEILGLDGAVTAATLAKLHRVALGHSDEAPRMRTIARLPYLDTNARDQLVKIVEDQQAPSRFRQVAIASLGVLKGAAIDVIQRHALDTDPQVAVAAVKVLGRVADVTALPTLIEAQQRPDPAVRQRAAFAAALIAHRFNIRGHDLPSVKTMTCLSAPPTAVAAKVQVRPMPAEEATAVKASLERHAIALPPAIATWSIECGKRRWALTLDQSVLSPWKPETFASRRHYLGQLAPRNPTTGTYSPGLTILTTGQGAEHLEVGLYRSNGRMIFGGEGHITGQVMRFSVKAVDRPGAAATAIEGSYGPDGLELKITSSLRRTRPPLAPRQLEIGMNPGINPDQS